MAEYDLTNHMAPYLDRHMVLPLMEFLSGKEIYDINTLLRVKIDLLESTKMVDYSTDVYKLLHPNAQEPPQAMVDKRQDVLSQMKELEAETEPLINILGNDETAANIQNTRDSRQLLEYLSKKGFKMEMLDTLYKCAKFHFECGNYTRSSQYLYFVRVLLPPSDRNFMNTMWGKLASDILMQDWENAIDDVSKLKEVLDSNMSSPLVLLQQRTWLIHWSLFVFFNHSKGRDLIIDMFLYSPHYLNAIQTMCPHILRYVTSAVITNRKRRQMQHQQLLKDLVKVIQQESYSYKDPITEFISCLYVNFDFDGAQKKLVECKTVISNDFFLVGCLDDFIENARLLIFETFCKIHNRISISLLAEKLNMDEEEEAERWIVNLIRNARLDAKIDSKLGLVVMGPQATSAYQQVIEKTKNLAFKTQMLVMNIEKKFSVKEPEVIFIITFCCCRFIERVYWRVCFLYEALIR
ncbi:hypothetical protein HELRODRAFT_74899 [Helobdella robusta]|uniref:Eukaryotic translation initiation factor 3 subunit E n=1 Tax=Helobdella robusta TaxID=6412 RepID=T1G1X5_HELRO|nr:hypothetical protein HELRODRAFT_74899 [Helobdella robusta]ESO08361.1 hypothetical protein HELRODRAFT_74899 [Helobdella robusta]